MDHQYLKNIKKGIKVVILTIQHKYSTGFVDEIATRKPFHEQGIMVRLHNGDIGRVQKILHPEPSQDEKDIGQIKKFMKQGENFHVEFKAEALWSITYNPLQIKESKSYEIREYGTKASKVIIAKSIAAFLNSEGGNIIIGIKENKEKRIFEIIGIEEDMKKLQELNIDAYKRMIIDLIKSFFPPKIFNHLHNYLYIEFVNIEEKTLCWLKIKKSDTKVFLKINDKEIFMIRVESENRTLGGEKLVDYCIRKWGNL